MQKAGLELSKVAVNVESPRMEQQQERARQSSSQSKAQITAAVGSRARGPCTEARDCRRLWYLRCLWERANLVISR